MLTFGSLFCGVGGFDLGFERAGMECRWQVEINPQCRNVLGYHWTALDLHRGEDVRDVKTADFVRPDVICGGFPCQDLSVAGRRAGLAGERSGLFHEFMRIAAEFRPGWLVIENVPGLLSSNGGRDMGTVLGSLGQLGYRWAYRVFDAQFFGVAQRRRRVFIVASAGDRSHPAEVLFDAESLSRHPPSREEARQDIAGTIDAGTGVRRGAGQNPGTIVNCIDSHVAHSDDNSAQAGHVIPGIVPQAMTSKWAKGSSGPAGDEHHNLVPVAYRTSGNCGVMEQGDRTAALNTATDPNQQIIAYQCQGSNVGPMGSLRRGNGNETGGVPFVFQTRCVRNGRGMPSNIAPALTSSEGGTHADTKPHVAGGSTAVRRLTPRECERLQGFPEDWTRYGADGTEISDSARYRMLGNAVAVPVAEWIGKRLMAIN